MALFSCHKSMVKTRKAWNGWSKRRKQAWNPGRVEKRITNSDGGSDGQTDWGTDKLTDWMTDGLLDWRTCGLTNWLTDKLMDWQTDGLTNGRMAGSIFKWICCKKETLKNPGEILKKKNQKKCNSQWKRDGLNLLYHFLVRGKILNKIGNVQIFV